MRYADTFFAATPLLMHDAAVAAAAICRLFFLMRIRRA